MRVRRSLDPRAEDGATIAIVAVLLVVFMGLLAISVDFGAMFLKRRQLVNAADAGALAAAQSYLRGEATCGAPGDAANTKANQLASANTPDALPDSTAGHTPYVVNCSAGTVTVQYYASQEHFFAQAIGMGSSSNVHAKAIAVWGGAGGASGVKPIMLSASRLSTCNIPFGVHIDDVCWFWFNDGGSHSGDLTNSEWGMMNLDSWGISKTAKCPNVGESTIKNWIQNGYPGQVSIIPPPPTYVCQVSGNKFSGAKTQVDTLIGQMVIFPVNDPTKQLDKDGNLCVPGPDATCQVEKYAMIGFAKLLFFAIYKGNTNQAQTFCGHPKDANARCMGMQWKGFDDTGIIPGGGQNFGLGAIGLRG